MTDSVGRAEPSAPLSPFACSRRVRAMLRRFRDQRGLSQGQLAVRMGWPPSSVLRHESSGIINQRDADALAGHYSLSREDAVAFAAAVDGARRPEWWGRFAPALDSGARDLLAHEAAAEEIRHYASGMPELLQTSAHYRAAPSLPLRADPDSVVAAQIHTGRCRVVTSPGARQLHFVLDESALWRCAGGVAVQLDQLDHLITLSDAGRVRIDVVPLVLGGGHMAALTPSITLFGLPAADPCSPQLDVVRAHASSLGIPVTRGESGWVDDGKTLFQDVCRVALDRAESRATISHVRRRLADGQGYAPRSPG